MAYINTIYPSATIVYQGQSITGSFNKFQVLASGSFGPSTGSAYAPGHITALKDGNGNPLGIVAATGLYLNAGAVVELMITSASLDISSAPIMFFNI
jgi:hypothetical protein